MSCRGQGATTAQTSNVVRVDLKTLKFEESVRSRNNASFASATVAIQMGSKLWVGSPRSDCDIPAKPSK